jgi:hypothetical protein
MTALQYIWTLISSVSLLATLSAQSVAAADSQLLIGVLEEVPGVYVGESSHYGVRVIFREDGESWRSFPDECGTSDCLASITSQYPVVTQWTISYEGKPLGTISARTPSAFRFYADIGIQDVEAGQLPLAIGERSADYSGFAETPVRRPLIATTIGCVHCFHISFH